MTDMEPHRTQPFDTPLADPALELRRQILITGLFKHVAEVQAIEDGFAFRFKRSTLLSKRIAEYLLFEGRHSPRLAFMFVVEPDGGAFWLQVRGTEEDLRRLSGAYFQEALDRSWSQSRSMPFSRLFP